jgi:predicted O-methyltransferase YrrM
VLIDYLLYFLKAKNAHGVHSPFVFDFYNTVFKNKIIFPEFQKIETLRNIQKKNHTKIFVEDLGAGSKYTKDNQRSIANITKKSSKKPFWGQLLFKIIQKYNYTTILDLGTSMGFTTAYMALAKKDTEITTFEGCPQTLNIANQNLKQLDLNNVEFITGNIDKTLPKFLKTIEKIDLVFFDANHKYEPTINYFNFCLAKIHNDSCFIFDDIYWSKEMKIAWKKIKENPAVFITIDLYFIGLVFFNKNSTKQEFILK